MPPTPVDLDALGAQYRDAKDAVPTHLRKQADAELAHAAWLKAHRGVPSHVLYDRDTGAPLDPELQELEGAIVQAELDVQWCRAVEVAAMEAYKGQPIEEILARNAEHRHRIGGAREAAMQLLAADGPVEDA